MSDCERLLVIIPAHNEESRVGAVVCSVSRLLPQATVLVIDDGSVDSTGLEAKNAGASVLSHPINLGYASALETGFLYALKHDFDLVVQMDSDGQHLAEEIPKILQPVRNGEADIVIGSRYLPGSISYRDSLSRQLGRRFLSAIYRLLTKKNLADPTSGFQCSNRRAARLFTRVRFPDDFPDVDVLLIAHYAGIRLKEVPVTMAERVGGKSMHSGLRPLYYIMKMLLSISMVVLNYEDWREYDS
jgi:glycosyltransferase involved in cell wall biosynthesis